MGFDEERIEQTKRWLFNELADELGENMIALVLFKVDRTSWRGKLKAFLVTKQLPKGFLERERFLDDLLVPPLDKRASIIAKTKEEFEKDFPTYYLDLAQEGIILYDSDDYMKKKLGIIKNMIIKTGLRRRRLFSGFIWEWKGSPSRFWNISWKGIEGITRNQQKMRVGLKNNIYIYEDEGYRNFLPLVHLRPVFELYCGMYTFRERIQKLYPQAKIYLLSRFSPTLPLSHSPTLFINGRAVLHSLLPDDEGVFVAQDEVVGFKMQDTSWNKVEIPIYRECKMQDLKPPINTKFLHSLRKELKVIEVKATVIKYPWELIKENESTIVKDFKLLKSQIECHAELVSASLKSENLWIGENTKIEEGVFLNGGPIYIGNKVHIRPPTIIDGPCFIGDGTIIDGAKIRPGTTIGRVCRIGGEVEASIFSNYSNKHHEGFVGHSFISEWVNLGAGTTTSDLKNTYGTVKVPINGEELDTGLLKVGSFIGDHTKTGIGTLITTGGVIGCFVNIYGGGTVPKYIPSFTWGTRDELIEYRIDKAIEVAKKVMARRKIKLTKEYKERISKTFHSTKPERKKYGISKPSLLKPKTKEEAVVLEKVLHGQL